ncbi:MAG TPA: TonB family protein [Steroidobacteraceae bacterium]|nr:TonB family protein [Steroidobacteraceae bacterium]
MSSQTRDEHSIAEAAAQISAVGETIEVLALTVDPGLLALLRQSVGANQRVWHAADRDQAVELIMAGNVGVIVIDAAVTGNESGAFCEQLRAQFPDVVLLVAGGVDEQTHLVKQITAGDIYRFLHKPISPARARQFVEAAVRRHLEGRTFTPLEAAPIARPRYPKKTIAVLIGVFVIGAAVAIFLSFRGDAPRVADEPAQYRPAASEPQPEAASEGQVPPALQPDTAEPAAAADASAGAGAQVPTSAPASPAASGASISLLLTRAEAAFAQAQLVAPAGSSALDSYRAVLAIEPDNREAQAGLDRIADQLLTNAETAMLENRIDDAGRDVESARAVRPNNMRLAFLSAQLGKERERRVIAQAREAAARGNHDRARSLLDRAIQAQRTPSPVLLQARRELDALRRGDSVEDLLRRANQRLQQNRLVEPANDNARMYIEQALAADPNNTAAQQARRVLADQLLARGRQAIVARDPVAAGSWLSQAEAMNVNRTALRAAQRDLAALRQSTARGEQVQRLSGLITERIGQDRMLEPAGDSALHYWQELRKLDPNHAALQPAIAPLGTRMVQQARSSITSGAYDAAQSSIETARSIGYTDLAAVERDLLAAREQAAFLTNVVAANLLEREKQVAPRYPALAERRGVEGWVELEFTIGIDGAVKDMVIMGSEPQGVFDAAARQAVSQWIYRPILRNGRVVEQRARLRLRFDVPE